MIAFASVQALQKKNGVYKIVDSKTGRWYVGSTRMGFVGRLLVHNRELRMGTHHNRTLQAIFHKDATRLSFFVVEVVEDMNLVLEREQAHIDASLAELGKRRLINHLLVAGSHIGQKRSALTKARISAAHKGKKLTLEHKEKLSQAKIGRTLSSEHKQKIGDSCRGKKIKRPTGILATWSRKYTPEQVRQFRDMKAAGMSYSEIMQTTPVSKGALQKMIARITYPDVV